MLRSIILVAFFAADFITMACVYAGYKKDSMKPAFIMALVTLALAVASVYA